MFLALLGALSSQVLLAGLHDRQLAARGWIPHRHSNSAS
jgi:hypothetical protein